MFIDETHLKVKAGDGGNGNVAFLRLKYMPFGGPAGGDGGKGGDVIFEATTNVDTLLPLYRKRKIVARNGGKGEGKNCSGASAEDVIVRVPPGTVFKDAEGNILADLVKAGETWTAVKGGRGGRGNQHFATATRQTPRHFEKGDEGEEKEIFLELKLIADVGLVGLPNAGKSTLLSQITSARPKIAPYPFTTKEPQLGIVDIGDYRQIVVADLPGLIEGAHHGAGLGDEFLRHVERTSFLCHVVDAKPVDESDPVENYKLIENELKQYSKELWSRPRLVVANKLDLEGAKENAQRLRDELKCDVIEISAATSGGVQALIMRLLDEVTKLRGNKDSFANQPAPKPEAVVSKPKPRPDLRHTSPGS